MRLAEFKVKLLVFLAGKLLQWAGTVRSTPENLSLDQIESDDEGLLLAAWSDSSASDDTPPEHWTRLFNTETPQPWLDLFKEKPPELLTHFDEQSVLTDGSQEDRRPKVRKQKPSGAPTSKPPGQTVLETSAPRSQPVNRMNYSVGRQARTWLNRLSFSTPSQPAPEEELFYVPVTTDSRPTSTDDQVATESDPTGVDASLSFIKPKLNQAVNPPTETAPDHSVKLTPAPSPLKDPVDVNENSRNDELGFWPARSAPRPQSLFIESAGRGNPEAYRLHFEAERTARSHRKRFHLRLRGSLQKRRSKPERKLDAGNAQAKSRSKTDDAKFINPASTGRVDNPQPRRNFSAAQAEQREPDTPLVLAQTRGRTSSQPDYVAPIPQSAPPSSREVMQDRIEVHPYPGSSEAFTFTRNAWPTLPPIHDFDPLNEMSMREAEVEALRRLDDEQRGVPWNA